MARAISAAINYNNLVLIDELNGALQIIGGVGELETEAQDLITWIPQDVELPIDLTFPFAGLLAAHPVEAEQILNQVFWLNYQFLMDFPAATPYTVEIATHVAYLRMQALRFDLVDPNVVPRDVGCRYNLCRRYPGCSLFYLASDALRAAMITAGLPPQPTIAQFVTEMARAPHIYAEKPMPILAADWQERINSQFADIVCLVAFMFRTRGHHYTDEMDATYRRLFHSTITCAAQETIGIPWLYVARNFAKGIIPSALDAFYIQMANEQRCSATLAIRLDAPCAGTAVIYALRKGFEDVAAAFDIIREKFAASLVELARCEEIIAAGRWNGGINRNYYGGEALRIDESKLAPLAATIMGALRAFAEHAPLVSSRSLTRLANSAPIVGSVVSNILSRVADSEAMIISYMPENLRALVRRQ